MILEVTVRIKVLILELTLPDDLVREFALQIHEEFQHLGE
jgi:hypothetical protein